MNNYCYIDGKVVYTDPLVWCCQTLLCYQQQVHYQITVHLFLYPADGVELIITQCLSGESYIDYNIKFLNRNNAFGGGLGVTVQ